MQRMKMSVWSLIPARMTLAVLICGWLTGVGATDQGKASTELQNSLGMGAAGGGSASPAPVEAKAGLGPEMDSFFVKIKAGFDRTAASTLLKSPKVSGVNGFFMKALKAHQTWYSLIRTDRKGKVVNEVIRVEGVSQEKRSVADQGWFIRMAADPIEHANLIKEDNGRYYLFWAKPVVTKVKGRDVFSGAVAVKIDIWDCFDRYAEKLTTPFSIRINKKLTLYNHLWSDTIKHVEEPFAVPGVDRIIVRYPGTLSAAASAAPMVPAVDSTAIVQARLDSARLQATADSAKVVQAAKIKQRNKIILAGVVVLTIILLILIVRLVTMLKTAMLMRKIDKGD